MANFKFEDLQPHVDMLCDALENKGASSSGIPNPEAALFANKYRHVLNKVRAHEYTFELLIEDLIRLNAEIKIAAKNNQYHRVEKIADALDFFILKEYNKITL
jgi:hypothetical protein